MKKVKWENATEGLLVVDFVRRLSSLFEAVVG